MPKNDKKFKIGIDAMLCTTAVAAVAIPAITYAVVNNNSTLTFANEMLDKFSKTSIQNYINENKSTLKEFNDDLIKEYPNIQNVRVTNIKPQEATELKNGTYLKLIAKANNKFTFNNSSEIDLQKYYINEEQNALWIWIYDKNDLEPLEF